MGQWLTGFVAGAIIAGAAYWRGLLARSGAVGAVVLATIIVGGGDIGWGVLLVWFFVSSSLLSRFKTAEKRRAAEKFDKGHTRDIGQVLANGGLAGVLAVGFWVEPDPAWATAFIGALAAAAADTWATETGTLARRSPRLITTGRPVPAGTSGGVTGLGTAAAAVGGLLTGIIGGILLLNEGVVIGAAAGLVGGLTGAMFDSFLGATVQTIYRSAVTGEETEKKMHKGRPTTYLRGWRWLNNDWVNFGATAAGAAMGALILHISHIQFSILKIFLGFFPL